MSSQILFFFFVYCLFFGENSEQVKLHHTDFKIGVESVGEFQNATVPNQFSQNR